MMNNNNMQNNNNEKKEEEQNNPINENINQNNNIINIEDNTDDLSMKINDIEESKEKLSEKNKTSSDETSKEILNNLKAINISSGSSISNENDNKEESKL